MRFDRGTEVDQIGEVVAGIVSAGDQVPEAFDVPLDAEDVVRKPGEGIQHRPECGWTARVQLKARIDVVTCGDEVEKRSEQGAGIPRC